MPAHLEATFAPDGARALLRTLRADVDEQTAAMADALHLRDADRARCIAHTIKPTCLLLGATALGLLCAAVEDAMRAGCGEPAAERAREMVERYAALVGALAAALAR